MSSVGAAARRVAGVPASQPVFPDEILAEIFLRLNAAADLARASAACTAFLRVVRFLRRNRSLYSPLLVGFLPPSFAPGSWHGSPLSLHHAEPPHRSASAARTLAQAADFTLSFLPGTDLSLCDASHGRLLVCAAEDIVVCDPLYRQYVRLPPIPVELTDRPFEWSDGGRLFLTPAGDEGTSFVVVLMEQQDSEVVFASVFSSAIGEWRGATFRDFEYDDVLFVSCRYYPHRSLTRISELYTEVLMLDTRAMGFSVVRLPSTVSHGQSALVDAGEGRIGWLTIRDGKIDLYCKAWPVNGVDAEEWQHEKAIPLPGGLKYKFIGVGDGYLLLQGRSMPQNQLELPSSPQQIPEVQYSIFTLKVDTLQIEKLCVMNKRVGFVHLYANFPPLLSLPSL